MGNRKRKREKEHGDGRSKSKAGKKLAKVNLRADLGGPKRRRRLVRKVEESTMSVLGKEISVPTGKKGCVIAYSSQTGVYSVSRPRGKKIQRMGVLDRTGVVTLHPLEAYALLVGGSAILVRT